MPTKPLWPGHPGYWLVGIVGTAALVTFAPKIGGPLLLIVILYLLLVGQRSQTLPWSH